MPRDKSPAPARSAPSCAPASRHYGHLGINLAIRPIHHQRGDRIEAHIFIAFLAYCLQVTLQRRLRDLAPGLTVRAVLEKFAAVAMVDVHLPTTDGRMVIMPRYTQPEEELKMLLASLKIELPPQPKPRITASGTLAQ